MKTITQLKGLMKYIGSFLIIFTLLSCVKSEQTKEQRVYQLSEETTYNDILKLIGEEKLLRGAEKPNADGSLGRNKKGYFHARFQINMTSISDYAVTSQNLEALEFFFSTVKYSFNHQLSDGGFELAIPSDLLQSSAFSPPHAGDLASGTAFFASSLGLSLRSLQQSNWFTQSVETQPIRKAIYELNPSIEKTLDYLISSKDYLLQMDEKAPNRLLFDALAYYTLGKYLSRKDAVSLAVEFMDKALAQTVSELGYFIYVGVGDSSYNGVAVKLALELYFLVDEIAIKNKLKEHIIPAMNWQMSRINENGKISTSGNKRVYDGGESFLGREKKVDYSKSIKALYYYGHLTGSKEVVSLGDKVLTFSQRH